MQEYDPSIPVTGAPAMADPLRDNFNSLFSSHAGVTVPNFYVQGTVFRDTSDKIIRVATTDSLIAGISDDHFSTIGGDIDVTRAIIFKSSGDMTTSSASFAVLAGMTVSLTLKKNDRALLLADIIHENSIANAENMFEFSLDGVALNGAADGIAAVEVPTADKHLTTSPMMSFVATQSAAHVFGLMARVSSGILTVHASSGKRARIEALRLF